MKTAFFAPVLIILIVSSQPVIAAQDIIITDFNMPFVQLPAASFTMGTTDIDELMADINRTSSSAAKTSLIQDELPAHEVRFEQPLLMAQTEVTQKLWLQLMGTRPGPEKHWQMDNWQQLPVVSVSWFDAMAFIEKLNQQSHNWRYQLPTEAQWEYAARAGSRAIRPFTLLAMDEHAWYFNNSNDEVQPVAQLAANAWGLYDMLGNVWEWTADWYAPDSYAKSAESRPNLDPRGPAEGDKKVRRGGSYHCQPQLIRPAYRAADKPQTAYSVTGFRLTASPRTTAASDDN